MLRPAARAGIGEQLGLVLAADPLADFAGVVGSFAVAAAMSEAEVVERHWPFGGEDRFNLRAHVVSASEVEAKRPAAAAASVSIASPQRLKARQLLLLALELPRIDEADDGRVTHETELRRKWITAELLAALSMA